MSNTNFFFSGFIVSVIFLLLISSCEKTATEVQEPDIKITGTGNINEWVCGQEYLIEWINNTDDPVNIKLMNDGEIKDDIGTFSHIMNSFAYIVEEDIGNGEGYYLEISSADDPSVYDRTGSFTILERDNELPVCSITDPQDGKYITSGDLVVITVEADDYDGEVSVVRFYIDDEFVGETQKTTFIFEWYAQNVSVGLHKIKAIAVDDKNAESLISEVTIVITDGETPVELISVPSGSFLMGSYTGEYNEKPMNTVFISKDYYLGKYEITNSQYCDILNYAYSENELTGDFQNNVTVKNSSGESRELLDLDDGDCLIFFDGAYFKPESGSAEKPVIELTWWGAVFFCNMLSRQQNVTELYDLNEWKCDLSGTGYRLPTEAEWEYAARYNDGRKYVWGDQKPDSTVCNYGGIVSEVTKTGTYSPAGDSKLGFCDMAGNAWEWCNDWYSYYPTASSFLVDPSGYENGAQKVLRGGNVFSSDYTLRTTYRECYSMGSGYNYGMRIVLSIR